MATTTNVPSSNFEDLQRDVQDATKFSNATGTYTNRVGKTIRPIPLVSDEIEGNADSVEAKANSAKDAIELNSNSVSGAASQAINTDIPNAINSLGLQYPPITYTAGLTLDSYTKTYEQGGSIYLWGGSLGTVTSGSFDESGWQPLQGDLQLRRDIAEFDSLAALILNTYDYGEGKAAKVLGSQAAQWVSSSTTGLTPNQTPSDLEKSELVDGTGRLWQIAEQGFVTPDMMGAVGDGATDDTKPFQAALNNGSTPVLVPPKKYAVTTIDIKNLEVFGYSHDSEIVQIGSEPYLITSSGRKVSSTPLLSDATVGDDSVIVANASLFKIGDYAIISDNLSYNPSDASYKNGEMLKISDISGGMITFETAIHGGMGDTDYATSNSATLTLVEMQDGAKIRRLKISGDILSTTGIILFDICQNASVEDVIFNRGGHYGVRFNNCVDANVIRSKFIGFLDDAGNGHVGYCVLASNATNGLHVANNTFGECRHGFTTIGGADGFPANLIIEGNTAKGTLQAAYDTHASGKYILIEGNISYDSKGSGINCRSPYTEILNNEVNSPSVHGISLSESFNTDVRIEGNTISKAAQLGVSAGVLADKVSIKNNIIDRAGLDGIRHGSSSTRTSIVSNVITDAGNGSANRVAILCIASSGSAANDSVIKGNIISGNASSLRYGISNSITKTTVKDNILNGTFSDSAINVIGSSIVENNTGFNLSPSSENIDVNPNADTLAKRDYLGNVKVGEAVADDDAINLALFNSKKGSSVYVTEYGAVGDGVTDDTSACNNALSFVVSQGGGELVFPKGEYLVSGTISTTLIGDINLKIRGESGAKIRAAVGFPAGKLIFITDSGGADGGKVVIEGIELDASNIPNSAQGQANDAIYVSGLFDDTVIKDCRVYGGTDVATSGSDSGVFIAGSARATVSGCTIKGFPDAGLYISADGSGTLGENFTASNNDIRECSVAIITKRVHKKSIIQGNYIVDCPNGIVGGEADSLSSGVYFNVSSNIIERCTVGINPRIDDGTVIVANFILESGYGNASTGTRAIVLQGSNNCTVVGNTVRDINPVIATKVTNHVGILIERRTTEGGVNYDCDNNLIGMNNIHDMGTGIRTDAYSTNTKLASNNVSATTTNYNLSGSYYRQKAEDLSFTDGSWLFERNPVTGILNMDSFNDIRIDNQSVVSSSRLTGGSGSAGPGNKYVEITIAGVTYKVLHDGIV